MSVLETLVKNKEFVDMNALKSVVKKYTQILRERLYPKVEDTRDKEILEIISNSGWCSDGKNVATVWASFLVGHEIKYVSRQGDNKIYKDLPFFSFISSGETYLYDTKERTYIKHADGNNQIGNVDVNIGIHSNTPATDKEIDDFFASV